MTNFFDDLPPYVPSPPPYAATSATARTDVIDLSRQQFPTNNEPFIPNSPFNDHDDHPLPSFKRIRISSSESTNYHQSNAALPAVPFPPQRMMMMPPPPPLPHNNNNNNNNRGGGGGGSGSGTSHIFFKTRLCAKFRHGSCRNGENCNFAHGTEDMRQPPPNWQEIVGLRGGSSKNEERPAVNWDQDQKIIHKMKLCKKYYNGEQCPYGEKCSFLHEDPAKFRDDSGRIRGSSAISIGTNGSPKSYRDGSNNNTDNNAETYAVNMGLDAARGNVRSTFWKTKLCIKWKTTGDCPFGQDCHFAHGESELNVPGGCVEVEAATGVIPISTYSTVPTLRKVPSIPVINDVAAAPPGRMIPSPPLATNEVEPSKKSLVKKWKWPKKMNGIYGDWLEDMPLDEHDVPSGMDKDT